jgi:hypothetical protein
MIATGASTRQEIVQAWRATGRSPSSTSRKCVAARRLKFTQIGIPPGRYSYHYHGWIETYWTPLMEIFATGTISDKMRARVKLDLEQRITGKFRRKIR